jgi:hypothetical protein
LKVASADQLYGATKWVLENPDEAAIMGRRGVKNVKERFDLFDVTLKWRKMYGAILGGRSMDENLQDKIMYRES